MNHETQYLSNIEALTIHVIAIKRYGGAEGVRDFGALDAALFRPRTGYYKDLIEEAAALFESLVINHPFVDGNKRVGFAVTDIFLRINGFQYICGSEEIIQSISEFFETNTFEFKVIEPWLRSVVRKRD